MSRSWDVFCKVVDNYGDAAVCWRLCSQLAAEQQARVRLWIDDLRVLASLCPGIDPGARSQSVAGVEVRAWTDDAEFGLPSEIVIEAFGCGLREAFVEAMAACQRRPVWIILEYLSAEPWVSSHHGLPSPHPRLPLERHFFFPGFVRGTGGVLREAALERRREAFEASAEGRARFWQAVGFAPPAPSATVVSLFGYENDAVHGLLESCVEGAGRTVVAVPESRLRAQVCDFFGSGDPGNAKRLERGALEVRFLPFLSQSAYDELLWSSDWNFVRGEDSFVRAQWACRPLVWHIYPQADDAHQVKLDAFLDLYGQGLDPGLSGRVRALWKAWNRTPGEQGNLGRAEMRRAWTALRADGPTLRDHSLTWASGLAALGDLAGNLAQYCEERLK